MDNTPAVTMSPNTMWRDDRRKEVGWVATHATYSCWWVARSFSFTGSAQCLHLRTPVEEAPAGGPPAPLDALLREPNHGGAACDRVPGEGWGLGGSDAVSSTPHHNHKEQNHRSMMSPTTLGVRYGNHHPQHHILEARCLLPQHCQ